MIRNKAGNEVAKAEAENRGRGVLEFTPVAGEKYEVTFYSDSVDRSGKPIVAKATISDILTNGLSVRVSQDGQQVHIALAATGDVANKALGMTIMHQGVVEKVENITGGKANLQFDIPLSDLQAGVNQLTVFDDAGRVYADRLFFVMNDAQTRPTLVVSGTEEKYAPFAPIELDISTLNTKHSTLNSQPFISLSVRDATYTDPIYDSGNILTEMLLASEIKGFVPNPEYFFQKNDEAHRRALDLLMLTQGWRRFEWREMAIPGLFELTHPNEQTTQVLDGSVREYYALQKEDPVMAEVMAEHMAFMGADEDMIVDQLQATFGAQIDLAFMQSTQFQQTLQTFSDNDANNISNDQADSQTGSNMDFVTANDLESTPSGSDATTLLRNDPNAEVFAEQNLNSVGFGAFQPFRFDPARAYVSTGSMFSHSRSDGQSQRVYYGGVSTPQTSQNTDRPSWQRMLRDETRLKREVLVHAEFIQPGSEPVMGEMETTKGRFRIPTPHFYGTCVFHLSASDTTKWQKGRRHNWVVLNDDKEDEYQEFYVRLSFPYPRFIKPYSWYQCHLAPVGAEALNQDRQDGFALDRNLREVVIRSKRGGIRKFDPSKPAFTVDAYDALNEAIDLGLNTGRYNGNSQFINNVARVYIGDMNMERRYDVEPRWDGRNKSFNISMGEKHKYDFLYNLDKVYVYTDYSPRREGSVRFEQANQPSVTVDLRMNPDGGKRVTYRDRYLLLPGFAIPEDFYHPNYAGRTPSAEGVKDYRRTLYWNPDLQLDADGRAHVTLYNNGKETYVEVSAEGQGTDGSLLYNE